LTPEQQEKAKACKTPEDVMALAKEVGYDLSEDELAALSGGIGLGSSGDEACLMVCSKFELCSSKYW
jgi:predicted ribosomally synthesized peptide with nif11-like leader